MTEDVVKRELHERLQGARTAFVDKLAGLSEYDVRRPMSRTGSNLLGLVKHLTLYEAGYFGTSFDKPYPGQPLPATDGSFRNRDHMWVPAHEQRADIMGEYERVCRHADATIEGQPLDAPGHVAWWDSDVTLLIVLVHMLVETNRHLGHADLIREELDGAVGSSTVPPTADQASDWAAHRATIEAAALTAQQETSGRG